MSTRSTMSLLDINSKVERIFKNPNINFFIVMNLILVITCYTFLTDSTQTTIRYILSKPIIIVASICIIILIGYFNLNIAILCTVLLFIMLFTTDSLYNVSSSNLKSNFTKNFTENFTTTQEDIEKKQNHHRTKYQAQNREHIENKVSKFANIFTKNIKSLKETNENQLKKGLLENKQKLLETTENENRERMISVDNTHMNDGSTHYSKSGDKTGDKTASKLGKKGLKEKFQSIEPRKFNPSSEEDTNLLITKEILLDMMNRIEYNYESTQYLKKYLKHRLEEIIDTNNLLKDEDE